MSPKEEPLPSLKLFCFYLLMRICLRKTESPFRFFVSNIHKNVCIYFCKDEIRIIAKADISSSYGFNWRRTALITILSKYIKIVLGLNTWA